MKFPTASSIHQDHMLLAGRPAAYWNKLGEQQSLKLFHEMAKRVPAYVKFLKLNGVNAKTVRRSSDLKKLPVMDKENYLTQYTMDELCWDGSLAKTATSINSSSGSTGEPFFWPLNDFAERVGRWYYELPHILMFGAHTKKTLVVNCYTLGTWMAGTYTLSAVRELAQSGYPISLISPGINKAEALRAVQRLAPYYDQVVIIGYPPFVKDLIDEGEAAGVDWKSLSVKMMYGGEGFNETWRDYVLEKVGSTNPFCDTASVYAASDAAIMAVETPASIAIKRAAHDSPELGLRLFGSERSPSLQQFHPGLRYLEAIDGQLAVSGDGAVPLLRYNLRDEGGVIDYDQAKQALDFDIESRLKPYGVKPYSLPLVYVFGRAHNTATIYAVNIYPENVRAGAEDKRIRHYLSGKFKAATEYKDNMDQYLHITFELAHGTKPSAKLQKTVGAVLVEKMRQRNSEYNRLVEAVGDKALPVLNFLPQGDPAFMPGAKLSRVAKA